MNNTIFYFFYNLAHKSDFFDRLVIFTANTLSYFVVVLAVIFLLFHHEVLPSQNPLKEFVKRWRKIILVFFSSGLAWVLAKILKILIHTPRPPEALTNIYPLFTENGFAFPSGHATFFMALAISIFLSHKKAGYVFIVFALLIGFARIGAGVHFPVDILGGFILGSGVAYLVAYFQGKM